MLEELIHNIREGKVASFEEFYILTYDTLYSYAWILTGAQKEHARTMLILTYCKVYEECEYIPEESDIYEWLYQMMDQIAIQRLDMTAEQIQMIKTEEENHETVVNLTEETAASVLLSVEEALGLMDEQEEIYDNKKKLMVALKFVFACAFLALAVYAACDGLEKLKWQLKLFQSPFTHALQSSEGDETGGLPAGTEAEENENTIKVGNKICFLSETGQVLYSLPLEESELPDKTPYNDEIQETEMWIYYLPSPEREDTKLSKVTSRMTHMLYRMNKLDQSVEVMAEEVQDYTIYQNTIYILKDDRIRLLSETGTYEPLKNELVADRKEDGIYLSYVLGDPVETNAAGTVQLEDRIYKLKGNRIETVTSAECREGNTIWYFETQNGKSMAEIYQNTDGVVTIFEQNGIQIDSFCKVGDWIYYSAYTRTGDAGECYSRIYKKPLAGGQTESVRGEFAGNIFKMYYSEGNQQIYAEYYPKSWENGRGVIAVIAADGTMNVLADPADRDDSETTGHDNLSFILAQGEEVYCFWNNRSWIRRQEAYLIWSRPIVLTDGDRIPVP